MIDEEYRMQVAYKQVYTILSFYNQDLLCLKIPKNVIDNLEKNSAKDYKYEVDPQNFDLSTLTEEASALFLIIFEKYFANKKQKKIIDKFLNPQNYEKYDATTLFKNEKIDKKEIEDSKEMIVYEKNFFKRIMNKIKLIFQKKEN